jgi:hypothetical protein
MTMSQVSPESGFSPRFCGGWAGSPGAGYFPNNNMTPELGGTFSGGVEMSPYSHFQWQNTGH